MNVAIESAHCGCEKNHDYKYGWIDLIYSQTKVEALGFLKQSWSRHMRWNDFGDGYYEHDSHN